MVDWNIGKFAYLYSMNGWIFIMKAALESVRFCMN